MLGKAQVSALLGLDIRAFSDVPDEEWSVYDRVFAALGRERIPFAIGGGRAKQCYSGVLRQTKDLDIYVLPSDRDVAIRATVSAGMADYYDRKPYDRKWIYRSCQDDFIVDIIWAMANQRAQVDQVWIYNGPHVEARGKCFRLVPPEELIWAAIYILQRDRSDWPDALNLLAATAETLDWDHLLGRVAGDAPLLGALVDVFQWLSPADARHVPSSVHQRLHRARNDFESTHNRAANLDTRSWFVRAL